MTPYERTLFQGYDFPKRPFSVIDDMNAKIARLKLRIACADDWILTALTKQLRDAEKARDKYLRSLRRDEEEAARDAADLHASGSW